MSVFVAAAFALGFESASAPRLSDQLVLKPSLSPGSFFGSFNFLELGARELLFACCGYGLISHR